MFFSIILSTIKLIINLIIIGFCLLTKILKRKILKIKSSKRKFLRFSFLIKFFKRMIKIIIKYFFFVMFNFYIFIILRFIYFFKFLFFGINLNMLNLYSIPAIFILYFLNYFLFIFYKLLGHFIFTIKIIILRNNTGFFIIIKKPVLFLNIIIKTLYLFNIKRIIFSFNKIIYNFIKTKYILLIHNFKFLKLLPTYINILINLYNYLYFIFLGVLKINLFKLIKLIINIINNTINYIYKLILSIINFIIVFSCSIPIIIYIFFRYYSKKYIIFLFKIIFKFLNNIKLIIKFTPKWFYYNIIWHLKIFYRTYINPIYGIYISTIKILQNTYTCIYRNIKLQFYKYKIFYIFHIKNFIFIEIYKSIVQATFNCIVAFLSCFRYIFYFNDINILLGYYSELLICSRKTYILRFKKYKNIYKNIYCIFPYFITLFFRNIFKNISQCVMISILFTFGIVIKIIRRLKYFIQKTYIRISLWIRHKIMLILTKRQQFYFKRYYIIRRARRRINIIRRYFRLQRRYLAWNIFQHSYSLLFLLIRNILDYCITVPIALVNKIILYDFNIFKLLILFLIKLIYTSFISIIYSLINTVFNIISLSVNSFFLLIKKIITLSEIILNTVLIKLYYLIYLMILITINILNISINIFIYIIQASILVCNMIFNNIINILIILNVVIQYIAIRLLEIGTIIYIILYNIVYYIIYYPCFWIYCTIYYIIYIVYIVCIFPIIVINQIKSIYVLTLFLISLISVTPIRYVLKRIQRLVIYIYFQRQADLIADKYALKSIKFTYNICYALIGLAILGTLIYTVDGLIYLYKKKKYIILIMLLFGLIYIYSDEKNVNELCYCITLTPEPLVYYLIDLSISLSNDLIKSLIELQHYSYIYITVDLINLFKEYFEYMHEYIYELFNRLNNSYIKMKTDLNDLIHFLYNYSIKILKASYYYTYDVLTDTNLRTTTLFNQIWNIHYKFLDDSNEYFFAYRRILIFLESYNEYDVNKQLIIYLNEIFLGVNNYLHLEKLYYPSVMFNYEGINSSFNVRFNKLNPSIFIELILKFKLIKFNGLYL